MLPGALRGISYYLKPELSKLKETRVSDYIMAFVMVYNNAWFVIVVSDKCNHAVLIYDSAVFMQLLRNFLIKWRILQFPWKFTVSIYCNYAVNDGITPVGKHIFSIIMHYM